MSNDLGNTTRTDVPVATRLARAGWRDPRLWIGVLLVAASVVGGARLLAAADDTVAVWAAGADLGAGSAVTEDDLEPLRVHFADEGDLDRYLAVDDGLPSDVVLRRSVGAGEVMPASAITTSGEVGLLHVPLEVEPHQVPPDVSTGSVIDVYLGETVRGDDVGDGNTGPALEAVTVVDAPPAADSFAVTGARQLVVAVPEADAVAFQQRYDALDSPRVRVLQRS